MQLVNNIKDAGSNVGANPAAGNGLVGSGASTSYKLYAAKEGVFVVSNPGATFGSDANQGNASAGLFGQVIVEPRGAKIYRSQVFEEELRLATTGPTAQGQPVINYEATYPPGAPLVHRGQGRAAGAQHHEVQHRHRLRDRPFRDQCDRRRPQCRWQLPVLHLSAGEPGQA